MLSLPRRLANLFWPPFLLESPSCTMDMRGDYASDSLVLLAFGRDIPVGFWYMDGELVSAPKRLDEFLYSLTYVCFRF